MKKLGLSGGLGQFRNSQSELTILDELKEYIPSLTEDETELLEKSILKEGVREPIDVWMHEDQRIIIDGHNRYGIATKNKVHFDIKEHFFNSIDEVKEWMIEKQLGRRNLTDAARTYFIGLIYNKSKKERGGANFKGKNLPHERTDEKIAKKIGSSPRTVRNAGDFANGINTLPAKEKQDILSGKKKVSKTDIQQISKPKKAPLEIDHQKKVLSILKSLPKEQVIEVLNSCLQQIQNN